MALADEVQLLVERKPAGILRMAAVDHVAERRHLPFRRSAQPHLSHEFAVHHGDLFARAQIGDGIGAPCRRHPEGDAAAGSAVVEAKHQSWTLRRAAMHERIDAERTVGADQPRLDAFNKVEIPAATSASHSRTPRDRRRPGR